MFSSSRFVLTLSQLVLQVKRQFTRDQGSGTAKYGKSKEATNHKKTLLLIVRNCIVFKHYFVAFKIKL